MECQQHYNMRYLLISSMLLFFYLFFLLNLYLSLFLEISFKGVKRKEIHENNNSLKKYKKKIIRKVTSTKRRDLHGIIELALL